MAQRVSCAFPAQTVLLALPIGNTSGCGSSTRMRLAGRGQLLLLSTLMAGQTTVRLITKEEWRKRHPQSIQDTMNADAATTTTDPNRVQIGVFYSYMFPSTEDWVAYGKSTTGNSYYEFDWVSSCDSNTCYLYTGPIAFSNVYVYAQNTRFGYDSLGRGGLSPVQNMLALNLVLVLTLFCDTII